PRVEALEVIDRRRPGIELLELVLGEVADREVARSDALAGQGRDRAGEQLDQRRLAGAVRAEQGNAIAGIERQAHAVEHTPGCIAGGDVVEAQQRRRQRSRLAELERDRRGCADRRDVDHALERLDAALRLARLAGLGAKAIDEALQVGTLALLLLEQRLLL